MKIKNLILSLAIVLIVLAAYGILTTYNIFEKQLYADIAFLFLSIIFICVGIIGAAYIYVTQILGKKFSLEEALPEETPEVEELEEIPELEEAPKLESPKAVPPNVTKQTPLFESKKAGALTLKYDVYGVPIGLVYERAKKALDEAEELLTKTKKLKRGK